MGKEMPWFQFGHAPGLPPIETGAVTQCGWRAFKQRVDVFGVDDFVGGPPVSRSSDYL
jgi:hypothetical protein